MINLLVKRKTMANTYTQIHLQFVFAVKFRAAQIADSWRDELHRFITGLVQSRGHKMLQINSRPDHIHILVGFNPTDSPAALMNAVKSESTKWINAKRLTRCLFNWQNGYSVFSYSNSAVPALIRYIQNQEAHHKKRTFLQEYQLMLEKFSVEFDLRNLPGELM